MSSYQFKRPVKEKVTRKSLFHGDFTALPVVHMQYRDDVDHSRACDGDHQWVRSIIVSGKRTMGKQQQEFWQIDTSVVWCEVCGLSAGPVGEDVHRLQSAAKYYAIMNPMRTPYTGISTSDYDGWVHVASDLEDTVHHRDWERDQFLAGGWV